MFNAHAFLMNVYTKLQEKGSVYGTVDRLGEVYEHEGVSKAVSENGPVTVVSRAGRRGIAFEIDGRVACAFERHLVEGVDVDTSPVVCYYAENIPKEHGDIVWTGSILIGESVDAYCDDLTKPNRLQPTQVYNAFRAL